MQTIEFENNERLKAQEIFEKTKNIVEMTQDEIMFLHGIIEKNKPQKLLELGVSAGGSSIVMLDSIKNDPNAMLYSIDWGTKYYRNEKKDVGYAVEEKTPELADKWKLFKGGLAIDFLEDIGGEIEFCLMDTMHILPGEVLDFLMVLPFLKKNALIVFHDTALHTIDEYKNSYCNCLMTSVLQGDKLLLKKDGCFPFSNICAIKLDSGTKERIFDVFNLLKLRWQYQIPEDAYSKLLDFFEKFYEEPCVDIFRKAYCLYNK